MSQKNNKFSRILSLVLRHDPEAIGLGLDSEGWARVDELLTCLVRHGKRIDHTLLTEIVAAGGEQRFRFSDDGKRIRANKGHSIPVDLKLEERPPPDALYHGITSRLMDAIEKEGLKKITGQYVHLSPNIRTAHEVGRRHDQPVILEIAAKSMAAHGFQFYLSGNGIWLTPEVPPDYLTRRFSI